jgi:hypothetical protein
MSRNNETKPVDLLIFAKKIRKKVVTVERSPVKMFAQKCLSFICSYSVCSEPSKVGW